MRLPRLRLRLWALMILVVLAALGMTTVRMTKRYQICTFMTDRFRSWRDEMAKTVDFFDEQIAILEQQEARGEALVVWHRPWENLESAKRLRGFHQAGVERYEARRAYYTRAVYLPFLPIPPDVDLYLPNDLLSPTAFSPPSRSRRSPMRIGPCGCHDSR